MKKGKKKWLTVGVLAAVPVIHVLAQAGVIPPVVARLAAALADPLGAELPQ